MGPTSRKVIRGTLWGVITMGLIAAVVGLLFVTDESTGSVYKVDLHQKALPQSSEVSIFSSEPAVHGVVLDPQLRLGYVTRSKVNVVDVFDPSTMKAIAR